MKAIVVAVDRKNGIGADNDLLWRLPADMKHFKETTMDGTIIMGRKTYESIGRALPGRENIIITRTPFSAEGIVCVTSIAEAYQQSTRENIYIIGGGQVYDQTLNDMDRLYVTYVDAAFPEATIFFPEVSCTDWTEISRDHHEADEKNVYAYDFVEFEKSKS